MWHDLVFLYAAITGLFIVVFRDSILPPRFFGDGQAIKRIALGSQNGFGDQSYVSVAMIYRTLGLSTNDTLAALFGFAASLACVILVRYKLRASLPNWSTTVLLAATILLSAVFLGYYSKDVFVLPATFLILLSSGKRRGDSLLIGWMITYGLLFRNYWLLVAMLFLAFLALARTRKPIRNVILGSVVGILVASIAIALVFNVSPDYFRSMVNAGRLEGIDSATLIKPFFVSLPEPLGGSLNNLLTLVTLMLPLPLAGLGGAYYIGLAAMITTIWTMFWLSFKTSVKRETLRANPTLLRSFALVLAFLVTQSLFEPDYGSYLRHLTPLLPCTLYLTWSGARQNEELPLALLPVSGHGVVHDVRK